MESLETNVIKIAEVAINTICYRGLVNTLLFIPNNKECYCE